MRVLSAGRRTPRQQQREEDRPTPGRPRCPFLAAPRRHPRSCPRPSSAAAPRPPASRSRGAGADSSGCRGAVPPLPRLQAARPRLRRDRRDPRRHAAPHPRGRRHRPKASAPRGRPRPCAMLLKKDPRSRLPRPAPRRGSLLTGRPGEEQRSRRQAEQGPGPPSGRYRHSPVANPPRSPASRPPPAGRTGAARVSARSQPRSASRRPHWLRLPRQAPPPPPGRRGHSSGREPSPRGAASRAAGRPAPARQRVTGGACGGRSGAVSGGGLASAALATLWPGPARPGLGAATGSVVPVPPAQVPRSLPPPAPARGAARACPEGGSGRVQLKRGLRREAAVFRRKFLRRRQRSLLNYFIAMYINLHY